MIKDFFGIVDFPSDDLHIGSSKASRELSLSLMNTTNTVTYINNQINFNNSHKRFLSQDSLPYHLASKKVRTLHNVMNIDFHMMNLLRLSYSSVNVPISCTVHGFSGYQYYISNIIGIRDSNLQPYDSLIFSSKASQQAFSSILLHSKIGFKFNSTIIPLGYNQNIFRQLDKKFCRNKLKIDPNNFVLLYVGRIDSASKSDLTILINAMHKIINLNKSVKFQLIIVGNGDNEEIQRLISASKTLKISNSIKICQNINDENLCYYYNIADIFVSLSDTCQESFGLTLLEALACGLPVIASEWSGYKEIINDNIGFTIPTIWDNCHDDIQKAACLYGWRYEGVLISQSVVINFDKLINCIQILVKNQKIRKKFSENALLYVKNYTWDDTSLKYSIYWENMISYSNSFDKIGNYKEFSIPYFDIYHNYSTHNLPVYYLSLPIHKNTDDFSNLILTMSELFISSDLVKFILRYVRMFYKYKITYTDFAAKTSRKSKVSLDIIKRHILWMAKHNLISLLIIE